MIRRFRPTAPFSPLGRVVHEIRIREDGSGEYWVQPIDGTSDLYSVITFDHSPVSDFEAAVKRGELYETIPVA